jgi:hypothetical protein
MLQQLLLQRREEIREGGEEKEAAAAETNFANQRHIQENLRGGGVTKKLFRT